MATTGDLLDVPGVLRGAPWAGTDDMPTPARTRPTSTGYRSTRGRWRQFPPLFASS